MPLFKGKASKAKPKKAIDYITNPDKAVIISSQSMDDSRDYAKQFKETCELYGKGRSSNERKYYHFKLSIDPCDNPTPEQSHKLVEKLAQELFSAHECVIATHNDTGTLHSHIIINAASFETGKKLHLNMANYRHCKDLANTLGAEMSLSIMDWRTKTKEKRERSKSDEAITNEGKYLSSAEQNMARNNDLSIISWKEALRYAIDEAKSNTTDRMEFQRYLQEHFGVTMPRNTAKTVSFIHPAMGETYAIRGNKLGADYTAYAIDDALQQNKNQNDRSVLNARFFTATEEPANSTSGASYTEPTITGTAQFPHISTNRSQPARQDRNRKRIAPRSISDVSAELRSLNTAVSQIAKGVSTSCDNRDSDMAGQHISNIKHSEKALREHTSNDNPKRPKPPEPVAETPKHESSVQPKPKRRSYSHER